MYITIHADYEITRGYSTVGVVRRRKDAIERARVLSLASNETLHVLRDGKQIVNWYQGRQVDNFGCQIQA